MKDEQQLKPGQKFATPTPGFGDRVFYFSLLRQRPDSAMAQQWCVDYGVLPHDEAAVLHKQCLQRKGKVVGSSSSLVKKAKQARVVKEEAMEPDMQVSGGDAIGRAVL